ncbi:MAG: membrane protein insertase YidC [Oscillospiraceae bacterium]|jgi:YidC/Oxa1 family membrane protein insertase
MSDIITYPFAMLLLWLYNITVNYGVAIILFAIILKFVFLPFQAKSKFSMMRMSRLTPYMKELEKKHKGNPQKYQEEVARLYRDEHVNPMSGCLWNLVPIIVLFMLYRVIRLPLSSMMRLTADQVQTITDKLVNLGLYTIPAKEDAYAEITLANIIHENANQLGELFKSMPKLVDINFEFLGLNLGQRPQWNFFVHVDWSQTSSWLPALGLFLIPIISGLLSYFSTKVSMATNPQTGVDPQQQASMKSMMIMMPLMSVWFGFIMPAGLGVYWIANSLLAMIQEIILNKKYNAILDIEDADRMERLKAKEAELERKRLETERLRAANATERNPNTSKKKLQTVQKAQDEARLAAERAKEKEKRRKQAGISNAKPDSQVGNRPYARGRAYVADRFTNPEHAEEATRAAAARSELDEQVDAEYDEKARQAGIGGENASGTETD